ncbi:GNAT family N-acetyltransferase [Streptomyces polyrhachis]|uniref:GNAT family N-acetyltransferase n=1 Tax=Streptomyces polyrhachis TaxID=1282885 RepID=A0ABW2GJD9_9ACTN
MLRAVHERDGYPVDFPADPVGWLTPEGVVDVWVAGEGDVLGGHVALTRAGAGDVAPGLLGGGAVLVVGRLFVAPRARGLGLGAWLLRTASRAARERGARAVLDVVASDTAAVALYERAGWQALGGVEQDWGGRRVALRCFAAPLDPVTPGVPSPPPSGRGRSS